MGRKVGGLWVVLSLCGVLAVDGRSFLDYECWVMHGCSFFWGVLDLARKEREELDDGSFFPFVVL